MFIEAKAKDPAKTAAAKLTATHRSEWVGGGCSRMRDSVKRKRDNVKKFSVSPSNLTANGALASEEEQGHNEKHLIKEKRN